MTLVGLLIFLCIMGLVYYLVTLLPLPAPFKTIALVVIILIMIVWLLSSTGVLGGTLFTQPLRLR